LRRKGYCWMERIEVAPCKNGAAARRFYQRIGAMIGAAYLLKAVDCHRDNVIAAGEHPVLVDVEALWHPSGASKPLTPVDLLLRSGFLSAPDGQSLQARSSVLAYAAAGQHVPRLGPKPLRATKYDRDIINGFNRAWRCVLGTNSRRPHFVRRLRRIRSLKRRVIYLATEKYAAIIRASIQPGALRSGIERDLMFSRLCSRRTATSAVIHAEIAALKRLDIPYFISRTNARLSSDNAGAPPAELVIALRGALY
jgi:lantibiotic modifying enzyme